MGSLQLARLVEIADTLYPFDLAEPWDNVGIQIGDPDRIVERIAFSLDPSPCALEFAARNHCRLLVTHHPILLSPINRLVAHEYPARVLMLAAKKEVDVVSLHTNLDAAVGGLNDHLAAMMKLEDVQTPASTVRLRLPIKVKS
ncbi:MAG: Nif3-like dinuclear metal center hexameric protein, partial [Desulfomonilaceae bacterium]